MGADTTLKRDLITLRKPGSILHSLVLPQWGLYKVLKYHENGFITTELEPNAIGRVNIRQQNLVESGCFLTVWTHSSTNK